MSVAFDETVLRQVDSEIRDIKSEFRDVVPEDSIDQVARESLDLLANSRVPQYVPLFVGRFTRRRVKEMAQALRR